MERLGGSRRRAAPLEPRSRTGASLSLAADEGLMRDSEWGTNEDIWQTIRPPMIPAAEDMRLVQQMCPPELLHEDAAPRILVLGVTPALIDTSWPKASELHAVDYDQVMIDLSWRPGEGRHCHCARWQEMPLDGGQFDLVVGDCSFNALPDIEEYAAVLREIARVTKPGAPLIARFFMRSDPPLTVAGALESVSGELAGCSTTVARLLLALACAKDDGSLRFGDIPRLVAERWGDLDDYLAKLGHGAAEIERTRTILKSDQRLNYPTEAQIRREFAPYYAHAEFRYPDYPAGGYCPTVHFA
jgi:SAM-dependent methyltransferase